MSSAKGGRLMIWTAQSGLIMGPHVMFCGFLGDEKDFYEIEEKYNPSTIFRTYGAGWRRIAEQTIEVYRRAQKG